MHIHRLEKIWLAFGFSMLAVFLIVLGIMAFSMGFSTPGSHTHAIDPTKVNETAPFENPILRKVGDNEYEAIMTAFAYGYAPTKLEVPAGATVHFTITSSDVVHGFQITGTSVNMMVLPGEVNHISHTFKKAGEYLILCNEYCGTGHEFMKTTLVVN